MVTTTAYLIYNKNWTELIKRKISNGGKVTNDRNLQYKQKESMADSEI